MSIALAPNHLEVRSFPVADTPHLLALLPAEGGLAWVQGTPNNQQGLVAWGEVARCAMTGPERFSRAQRWWHEFCDSCVGDDPIAFASFAFSSTPGDSVVVVPQVVVRRTGGITTATVVGEPGSIQNIIDGLAQQLDGDSGPLGTAGTITWQSGTTSIDTWQSAVDSAIARINAGELDKVVLARDVFAELELPLHVGALLNRLNDRFPDCWTFCVDGLVGATPELLVRRQGNAVTSRVLAGTIRRSQDAGRDGALAMKLLGSDKDQEEHAYAVESVAMALANHCTDLRVPQRPFILRLANVQHLATDVSGSLVDDAPALALAASLHPTAAVCGTPTERAKQVIRELEGMDRGRYAGPVGWIDAHGDGEFGIALRCAQIDSDRRTRVRLFAGCGIVAGSDSASEIAESEAKFGAMRSALTDDREH